MFRKLVTLQEAQLIIQEKLKLEPLGSEEVSLLEAADRVLAENVISSLDIPPFDRSRVDGYAVRAEDTFGAQEKQPVTLRLCGTVHIGELPKVKVGIGEAAEIATGAPVPHGADAVVMVEQTEKKNDNVSIFSAIARDGNITKAGADVAEGEIILKAGTSLGSREIGAIAAIGLGKARVFRVPRVAVLSTGPEITEPGKKLSAGKIYDINAYSLCAAVLESGGKPVYLGVFPDRLVELQEALRRALSVADVVVTSGGVSVGPKDIVPEAVASLAQRPLILSGIAIKPGKPTTVGVVNGKVVFSLPGHPTSALLVFHLIVRPVIRQMARKTEEQHMNVKALVSTRMLSAKGRRTFAMVTLKTDETNKIFAEPVPSGDSGAITTLARADGFIEIPENVQFVDANEEVTVHLFKAKMQCTECNER